MPPRCASLRLLCDIPSAPPRALAASVPRLFFCVFTEFVYVTKTTQGASVLIGIAVSAPPRWLPLRGNMSLDGSRTVHSEN